MSVFDYKRRTTTAVNIGNTPLGADYPIRLQSMTSTSTMDTEASVAQCKRIIEAGADYVRLTTQGVREATNIGEIRRQLRNEGYTTPLVADIHFNPRAAEVAATQVEKVRINPGNFVDPGRTFKKIEFTDDEYAAELERIEARLTPFIQLCRDNHTAIRIGVNHGSLSDRIMSRYGDTPAGMAESAMEFLRVFVKHSFTDVVISIKASNTVVMTQTVKLLIQAMDREGMAFPLHLGVTEAGNGEDGRVKSAVGIGSLLLAGIGDTIRVSLSEEPEFEVPVARLLVDHCTANADEHIEGSYYPGFDPIEPKRRKSRAIGNIGGDNLPVAIGVDAVDADSLLALDVDDKDLIEKCRGNADKIILLTTTRRRAAASLLAALHRLTAAEIDNPIVPQISYTDVDHSDLTVIASADMGWILLNGFADGISIRADRSSAEQLRSLQLAILQATRLRFSHTEYISCPGCGRTLFDLQSTVNAIKAATSHLPALKIGVMGCIVNGPGEMADADYGYVGAAVGMVSLYKGRQCIEKNIPSEQALQRLIDLLKTEGKWIDPQ